MMILQLWLFLKVHQMLPKVLINDLRVVKPKLKPQSTTFDYDRFPSDKYRGECSVI